MTGTYVRSAIALIACLCIAAATAHAGEPPVEENSFAIEEFTARGDPEGLVVITQANAQIRAFLGE